ncbi:two-component system, chemotaxis family, response regulator CheY [Humidesulfovibrio mexicanus]|uniref:Two-component system, chemotaxis family, response regulator CheY n=1 Tax=Humidesulfovibrio mexicanus TaxID=147047 RepID=A0A238XT71_9BACT|nr:response regulator [Humidesulfovibrio mexicanus]SNR61912.1 two-component system, chemotaxis family, response regulator CheY [Humidesulfovibrio mexicanus]
MRILIAEDDCASARYMSGLLARFGECVLAEDGELALAAYCLALEEGRPFQLLCLDIMMPRRNGQEVLEEIRRLERLAGVKPGQGVKIIMTTALGDMRSVMSAYRGGATAYITKPILTERLYETICSLGFEV